MWKTCGKHVENSNINVENFLKNVENFLKNVENFLKNVEKTQINYINHGEFF